MLPPKLLENEHFAEPVGFRPETVFRFCTIEAARDGGTYNGAFLGCVVQGFDWYAPLLAGMVIADTRFRHMTFSGASIRQCHFIACSFENCRFTLDNMGGNSDVEDCTFTECRFDGCEMETAPGSRAFAGNRWYRCTRERCSGFDGEF